MNKYYVTMSVSGTITIEIDCNGNEQEAEKKANEIMYQENFGNLENIEWKQIYIE